MKQQKYYKRDISEVYENSETFPGGSFLEGFPEEAAFELSTERCVGVSHVENEKTCIPGSPGDWC